MLQAVVFDFDGTIAPSSFRQEKWFKHYSKENNKEWLFKDFDEFLTFYNHECSGPKGVQHVYDKLGLPCDMKDRNHIVWRKYESYNQEHPLELYGGMKETIEKIWEMGQLTKNPQMNRRLRLGINTTNSWGSIYRDLAKADVIKYFDSRITEENLRQFSGVGDCEPLKKPSTVSLAMILGLIDSDGGKTLHIGDTLNDLRSSQKVMVLNPMNPETLITVGACYGYEGREKLEQGVEKDGTVVKFDYLIDEPKELVKIVENLLK